MSACAFRAVVPARYASTRLPGKPLLDIEGVPMVIRVARQAQASGAAAVVVATDHVDIARIAHEHGVDVEMTAADHPSGTDRIAEVARKRGWSNDDIVVNVQGDEPLIEPARIAELAERLAAERDAAIATLCCPLTIFEDFINPNIVKVVLDHRQHALYFSRASIPYPRDAMHALQTTLPAEPYFQRALSGFTAKSTRRCETVRTPAQDASAADFAALAVCACTIAPCARALRISAIVPPEAVSKPCLFASASSSPPAAAQINPPRPRARRAAAR